MGWLVAALSGMQEEQLVQSHGGEGADQQGRGFVFAVLHINSWPCFLPQVVGVCWHWPAMGLLPL